MAAPEPKGITTLLNASRTGDAAATERLLQLVYPELRRRASVLMSRERPDHTLGTGGLVNEAFIELFGSARLEWKDRNHFFIVASKAMRHILVDYGRKRLAAKRNNIDGQNFSGSADFRADTAERIAKTIDIAKAVECLEETDARLARIVELRFFADLSVEETAKVLDMSPANVVTLWTSAKKLLLQYIIEGKTKRYGS
jgi:RNA polymerase sigma-70 factor, ECF subfamily